MTTSSRLESYIGSRDTLERIRLLREIKANGDSIPLSLCEDLLLMDLGGDEQRAVLAVADASNQLAWEHFLTSHIPVWNQDLAVIAVRDWASRGPGLLAHRFPALARLPHLPQRVRYTILDEACRCGGATLIRANLEIEGLNDLSPAFHALLLYRALQWNISDKRLEKVAEKIIACITTEPFPDSRAFGAACVWLARFSPGMLKNIRESALQNEFWPQLVKSAFPRKSPPETDWPVVWMRHMLEPDAIAAKLTSLAQAPKNIGLVQTHRWPSFAGIPSEVLRAALIQVADPSLLLDCVTMLGHLLEPIAADDAVARRLVQAISALSSPDREHLASSLFVGITIHHRAIRELLSQDTAPKYRIGLDAAGRESEDAAANPMSVWSSTVVATSLSTHTIDDSKRRAFFDCTVRGQKVALGDDGFWGVLLNAWNNPSETILKSLTIAGRKQSGVFMLAWINTLGRFRHVDAAALKLLDFVRTTDPGEQRSVVRALGEIGTSRALQELVSWLTRPNTGIMLQLEICQALRSNDLTLLQPELRAAIQDMNLDEPAPAQAKSDAHRELSESLKSLLMPVGKDSATARAQAAMPAAPGARPETHDETLSKKIPNFRILSGEVKRALRTAEFFTSQVGAAGDGPTPIDLSPAIDMQYKALELFFRENFEEACSRVIQNGTMQRKLDVLGYARPIVPAMEKFENYIASLPVVADIPFFSKFKLRKMLQAICQFRPGRRFTLDGLKAFGLFFLCFGRQTCAFGLAGLYPLPFKTDNELAEFARLLHMFQDARNRAVHEGLPPDARKDITGVWRMTAEIIGLSYKLMEASSHPSRSS